MHWSPQKRARRAEEQDEPVIRQWVKRDWPAIKETPPAESLAGVLGQKRLSAGSADAAQLPRSRNPYVVRRGDFEVWQVR
jgi:hypothetical protein